MSTNDDYDTGNTCKGCDSCDGGCAGMEAHRCIVDGTWVYPAFQPDGHHVRTNGSTSLHAF